MAHPGEGPGGPGPGPPTFLDQVRPGRPKTFFWTPTLLPRPYLKVWIRCWTIHKEWFFPLSVDLITHTKHDRWSLGQAFISYFLPVLLLHYYVCSSVHVPGHACLCVLDRPLRLHSEIALRN